MKNYTKYLDRARATGIKTHMKTAATVAAFFFGMFAYYSYAYYTGTILITKPKVDTNYGD